VILGFRREVDENCALLGYYAANSGNLLSTFRDNLSVPSSGVKNSWTLKRFVSSPKRPDRRWGPPSLLLNGCRWLFPGVKRLGREPDQQPHLVQGSVISGALPPFPHMLLNVQSYVALFYSRHLLCDEVENFDCRNCRRYREAYRCWNTNKLSE